MRRTSVILETVVGGMLLAALPAAGQTTPIQAGQAIAAQAMVSLGPKLDLKCAFNPQSSTAVVTNTLTAPIPAGTELKLHYVQRTWGPLHIEQTTPTDVERHLSSALAQGHSVGWQLYEPNPIYGCKAWFFGGLPDLQLVRLTRFESTATLVIRNNSPFADAGPFVVRIKAMKCSQVELAKTDFPLPGPAKGQTVPINRPLPRPPGVQYYDAYLDATNTVKESNENNNGYTEVGVCIH